MMYGKNPANEMASQEAAQRMMMQARAQQAAAGSAMPRPNPGIVQNQMMQAQSQMAASRGTAPASQAPAPGVRKAMPAQANARAQANAQARAVAARPAMPAQANAQGQQRAMQERSMAELDAARARMGRIGSR